MDRVRKVVCRGSVGAWSVGLLWIGVLTAGLLTGIAYEGKPAAAHSAVLQWPRETNCRLAGDRPTLVVFLHPLCPCSRATVSELENIRRTCDSRLNIQIVFLQPDNAPWRSEESEYWKTAVMLASAEPVIDQGGVETRRFGVTTSGEALLFAADGSLKFHGGITPSRGHGGRSHGRQAIETFVKQGTGRFESSNVYGCSLLTPRGSANSSPATRS